VRKKTEKDKGGGGARDKSQNAGDSHTRKREGGLKSISMPGRKYVVVGKTSQGSCCCEKTHYNPRRASNEKKRLAYLSWGETGPKQKGHGGGGNVQDHKKPENIRGWGGKPTTGLCGKRESPKGYKKCAGGPVHGLHGPRRVQGLITPKEFQIGGGGNGENSWRKKQFTALAVRSHYIGRPREKKTLGKKECPSKAERGSNHTPTQGA